MADLYTGLENGSIDGGTSGSIVIEAIASEAVDLGSPVILVVAATGERLPRVSPDDTQGAYAYGVVVAGVKDGTFSGSDQSAADAAGEAVSVCIFGRCKVKVNGDSAAILLGSNLTVDAVDGIAELAATGDEIFGVALVATTSASDFIPCLVQRGGLAA